MTDKIAIQNVVSPGRTYNVDATKYEAMKTAVLKVIPGKSPGMTVAELLDSIRPKLPQDVFPGGAKAGWWLKAVQLDLEAKSVLVRENTKPLRLHKA
jgi:hypothetical protein